MRHDAAYFPDTVLTCFSPISCINSYPLLKVLVEVMDRAIETGFQGIFCWGVPGIGRIFFVNSPRPIILILKNIVVLTMIQIKSKLCQEISSYCIVLVTIVPHAHICVQCLYDFRTL